MALPHEVSLIATVAVGLGVAFIGGFIATRLKLPALVGYLLAGIAVGPFTPGFVADGGIAGQLAELGVILLMFGVGTHFSLRDLWAVRRIALPGAVAQIAVATLLGVMLTSYWDWPLGSSLVFGLALSVASTVVLLRALEERGALDTVNGRIAVGWLVVEDLAMVLALILLPAFAGFLGGTPGHAPGVTDALAITVAVTFAKIGVFFALMYLVGVRLFPWLFAELGRIGSSELVTLFVTAISISIAFLAAELFGVSLALGAFIAGVVVNEADLSHRITKQAESLEHVFAVLFFVSMGMLFDPAILVQQPLQVLAVLAIIMVGKSLAALVIVLAFRYPMNTALLVSASLAQIGEFSFILAGLGVMLGLLPPEGRDLILAGALLSITLNPITFGVPALLERRLPGWIRFTHHFERAPDPLAELQVPQQLSNHVVLIGYGRVGETIGAALIRARLSFVVVEQDRAVVERLRGAGLPALFGDASIPGVLKSASLEHARLVAIATPDAYQSRRIYDLVKAANSRLVVVVRTHSEADMQYFQERGADLVLMAERQLADAMASFVLQQHRNSPPERASVRNS